MRTFIELAMPDGVRDYVRQRQDQVCRHLDKSEVADCFRWTQITSVHLTLRFLGETTTAEQQQIAHGLEEVAEEWSPLSLGVGRLGGFPSVTKPRVLWLGIQGDLDGLNSLQAAVERLVQQCGFEPDVRPYSPHLTIARTKRDCSRSALQASGSILSQVMAEEASRASVGRFAADALVHMRSDLRPTGAVYTPLSTHRLAA